MESRVMSHVAETPPVASRRALLCPWVSGYLCSRLLGAVFRAIGLVLLAALVAWPEHYELTCHIDDPWSFDAPLPMPGYWMTTDVELLDSDYRVVGCELARVWVERRSSLGALFGWREE